MNLCDADLKMFYKCEKLAYWLAGYINHELKGFYPHRRPVKECAYGLCDPDTQEIWICFREKHYKKDGGQWYDKPIPVMEIVATVAHEVAHLVHRRHTKAFKELEKALIPLAKKFFKNLP